MCHRTARFAIEIVRPKNGKPAMLFRRVCGCACAAFAWRAREKCSGGATRGRGDFRARAAGRERSTGIVRRVRSGAGAAGVE
ncbi:hypothetical protein BURPS1655_D1617 [Burkholderia pseudomallei 1655]|nr:hypothetical protein BURPS1655_D1617 [Burkholderia pseudomallei 1655]